MKKTNAFLLVLLLSIIHVHLSINTQDNGLNPLTFLVLLDSQTLWLSEKETFVLGGILIQSVVTMGIARFVIKWGNYPIWIADIVLCIFIGFLFENIFCLKSQLVERLNSFYCWLYDTEQPYLGSYAFLFSTTQIMLLVLYPLGSRCWFKFLRITGSLSLHSDREYQ